MKLTIDTDRENDLCYLSFGESILERGIVSSTLQVSDDLALDFDAEGHLVGIDVMNATNVLGEGYDTIQMDSLVGVKEAAALLKLRTSNFVRDLANQPDFPKPVAELGSGRIWLGSQVLDYAEARRKKPAPVTRSA